LLAVSRPAATAGANMAAGGLPRGVTQPDNGLATSGPGQWHSDPGGQAAD
jgi:hypothetical protein